MSPFQPCADAPHGVATNCYAMDCKGQGCALVAPQVPVSLDDLTMDDTDREQLAWEVARAEKAASHRRINERICQCPDPNPDCEHPACPRWPQPGHFATEAAELVDAWETGGKGYGDLEQRIAAALAKAATREVTA